MHRRLYSSRVRFLHRLPVVAVLCLFAARLGCAQQSWQDQSIYQIVTDRFFNGDSSNDNADGNFNPAAGQGVHGGDFKGVEQKLDYIKSLGATAIWISPVVKNGNGDYHGYAGTDFYNVAPHFGTLADLKHLIDTAHSKGLLVIDDVVVNHGSQLLNSNDAGYPNFQVSPGYNLFYRGGKQYAPPFDPGSGQSLAQLFHNNGFIQDFNNTAQVETGYLEGLDDLRTESGYVQTQMTNIYKFWMDQGFDAFRVDTVKHVGHDFWDAWCPQIHQHAIDIGKPDFFAFGEVYDGSDAKVGSYTGQQNGGAFELNSALDYPLYFSVNPVFALANSNTKQIEDHYHSVDANYDGGAQMRLVTFLDNHDQPRFLNSANANGNEQRLSVALAFLYTARGIPALYYGTEQGFSGGADPGNREDMFAGQFEQGPSSGDNFNETHALFQLVAKLNNLKRLYPALRSGAHVNLWNNPTGPGLFAYSRVLGSQELICVFNTSSIPQLLPARPTTYAAGTVLLNLFDANDAIVIGADNQTPPISVSPNSARIYLAQSQVLPLDPVMTAIVPAHDRKTVATTSPIIVSFSKPMDTASVEAAFSTVPATTGAFTWSDARDQLTYRATGGLPELTSITVHLNDTAAASDGTKLHAPFDSQFATAQKTIVDVTPPTVSITTPVAGQRLGWTGSEVIEGTAADDTAVAKVQIRLDGEDWVDAAGGGGQWTHPLYPQFYLNGPHTFYARAVDTAGNISPVASVSVTFATVPGSYEKYIFPYGSAGFGLSDCSQKTWEGDKPYSDTLQYFDYGYIGGNVYVSQNSINGVCAQSSYLYRAERYGSSTDGFMYRFKCPPGIYQVDLMEAETLWTAPNQRRFDVYAQGGKVLQNLDIFGAAGGANNPLTETFITPVANALLELQFRPVFDSPRASAIHVKKIADIYSDSDGIADWWRLEYFGHATGSADDHSRASDDPDGDGKTNLEEFLAQTDPNDPQSQLRIINVQRNSNSFYAVILAQPNVPYQLQRSDTLQNPNWVNVGSPTVWPGNTPAQWWLGDSQPTASKPGFYRVVVASP